MNNYLGHKSITDLIDSVVNGKSSVSNNHVKNNINNSAENEVIIESIRENKCCE